MGEKEEHFHIFEKYHKDEEIIHYDVCILGGGPAGLTSAIYASRYGLHTALIAKDIGGMANLAHKIENYPGFEGSGFELMQKFWKQAKNFDAEHLKSEIVDIVKDKTGFMIELQDERVVHSKSIILALGTEKKKLGIKGEDEFLGKGVSYCPTCDGNFFKNKIVSVIGGKNSAAKAALLLSEIAKKVYIIYRQDKLNCDKSDLDKIQNKKNIELVLNSVPVEIMGKTKVEKLVVNNGKDKEIKLEGIFIEIGSVPVSGVLNKLKVKLDEQEYVIVDDEMKTNIRGVFAAGDLIKSKLKQVVIAAGQGAIAAKSAYDYVENL